MDMRYERHRICLDDDFFRGNYPDDRSGILYVFHDEGLIYERAAAGNRKDI